MKTPFQNSTGISLITGTVATVATMALHPSGGSADHILKIQHVLIASHSIAIFSLPFLLFGFFGLSYVLSGPNRFSFLGLIMMGFGLITAMMAATLNGITLPIFISDNYGQDINLVNLVRSYGMAFSKPMSYIFIAMSSMSIFIWSLLLIRRSGACRWVGYLGIAILALTSVGHLAGLNLVNLWYFRIFVFGIVVWNLCIGILLVSGK